MDKRKLHLQGEAGRHLDATGRQECGGRTFTHEVTSKQTAGESLGEGVVCDACSQFLALENHVVFDPRVTAYQHQR
jgi:hypothetical protein